MRLKWLVGGRVVSGTETHDCFGRLRGEPTAMGIGKKCDGMTEYACSMRMGGLVLFDLGGFRETGGMGCDLVNDVFMKGIVENGNSVMGMTWGGFEEVTEWC